MFPLEKLPIIKGGAVGQGEAGEKVVAVTGVGGDQVGQTDGTRGRGGMAALLGGGDGLLKGDHIDWQRGLRCRGRGQGDLLTVSGKVFFA